jgi:hypothetical protein
VRCSWFIGGANSFGGGDTGVLISLSALDHFIDLRLRVFQTCPLRECDFVYHRSFPGFAGIFIFSPFS